MLADRIGMMGFSAGGHLTSTVGTHFDAGKPDAADPIDRASSRPDFLILGYPVVSFDPAIAHMGSRRNLLGENPDPKLVEDLSNELRVTPQTPPTFLFHTNADTGVPRREQRAVLPRAAQGEGPGGDAHLRERSARRRPGARRSRAERVAVSAVQLAAGPGIADAAGAVTPVGVRLQPDHDELVTSVASGFSRTMTNS